MVRQRNSITPSYRDGFAESPEESKNPNFWKQNAGVWAPFLGITGDRLIDQGNIKNHAPLINVTWGHGVNGPTLVYSGSPSKVVVPDHDNLSLATTGYISTAIRFKVDNLSHDHDLLVKADTVAGRFEWLIRVESTGEVNSIILTAIGGPVAQATSVANVSPGEQTIILFTADLAGEQLTQYFNGEIDGFDETWGGIPGPNNVGDLYLGTNPRSSSRTLEGEIDYVQVWNRVLNRNEARDNALDPSTMFQLLEKPASTFATSFIPYPAPSGMGGGINERTQGGVGV